MVIEENDDSEKKSKDNGDAHSEEKNEKVEGPCRRPLDQSCPPKGVLCRDLLPQQLRGYIRYASCKHPPLKA